MSIKPTFPPKTTPANFSVLLKDKENRKCNLINEPESTSIFVRILI